MIAEPIMRPRPARRCAFIAAVVLAAVNMLGGMRAATGQSPSPTDGAQESPRSAPPDRTPYVRPAIPEDRIKTPLPHPESERSQPNPDSSPRRGEDAPRQPSGR